jgi:tRNA(fMet)-specific endonuclease VapC
VLRHAARVHRRLGRGPRPLTPPQAALAEAPSPSPSDITAGELLHGVPRATHLDVRAKRSAFVEGILERFPLFPVDLACARAHAQIWAKLRQTGTIIGPHDLWLAATCVAHGFTMVTADVRELERVPGLTVELWSEA